MDAENNPPWPAIVQSLLWALLIAALVAGLAFEWLVRG